ncbi:MAG: alkaline phosphatase [Gammaproteobacteria bacterium]|nr:alkaline phosphatase [Gammaproteobacteria bacterium]
MKFKAVRKTFRTALVLVVAGGVAACQPPSNGNPDEARNVILFVGDGMGVATVTAARIFDGQSKGLSGEEHVLPFETFPNVALVKTYNTNQQVSDSAGTITAMLTGTKTRAGVINVGPEALRQSCEGQLAHPLTPITVFARENGKAIGAVTTTRITHATPAGIYARTAERDWESDANIDPADWERGCRDVAWQLVHAGDGPQIAMGGGSEHFFGADRFGQRKTPADDLVRGWLADGANRNYVTSADQLDGLQPGQQVLGLFASSHMTYIAEKTPDSTEPTLTQMATTAVRLLEADETGYFLLVEGGRIDHGHHDGKPGWAMLETQEFANAVAAVLELIDLDETLVLVTADHSHVFTLGGYATRGNPILGLVTKNDESGRPKPSPDLALDGQPYTTLSYANGPGAVLEMPRPAPGTGIDAVAQSLVPVFYANDDGTIDRSETHGGEDVALYAIGPGSGAVRGVIEQNRIYDIMMAALGLAAEK